MDNLKLLLSKCQNKESEAVEELVNRFYPLIKKNSKRLYTEDRFEDVQSFFIELIFSENMKKNITRLNNDQILKYIKTSVENYCSNSIKKEIRTKNVIVVSSDINEAPDLMDYKSNLYYSEIEIQLLLEKILTKDELMIVTLNFIGNYTEKEISTIFSCSQSAINQKKKKAVLKLKNHIEKTKTYSE